MATANLISLGGYELTDDGRTFSDSLDERMVQNELASGSLRRYSKARKRKWDISWNWLPNTFSGTYDRKHARDIIRTLASAGTEHTFIVRDLGGGTSTYTVFVESYSEKLLRRDFVSGTAFYDVSLNLVEV